MIPTQEEFSTELKKHTDNDITLYLSFLDAWTLFTALQLILQHPKWPAYITVVLTSLAEKLEYLITPTPALAKEAQQGWDPEYDTIAK